MLMAFAPFIAFAVLTHLVGPAGALAAAAAVSAALILRDIFRGGGVKILEAGTFVLFGGLALYTFLSGAVWSVIGVRLVVDAGLLLVVLTSMAVGQPFTQQYAREHVLPSLWQSPQFMRTNYVITGAWALAFAVMVAAEAALLYLPGMPHQLGLLAIILALVGAFKFTNWYPQRAKGMHHP